jgi:hypothetical protein
MMQATGEGGWAANEFGGAVLGNQLRVQRLVAMAAACAKRPAGKITAVFSDGAAREAAYRFLESEHSDPDAMMAAAHAAGARRCAGATFVYVPIDEATLSFTDEAKTKRLGMAGTFGHGGQGLEVISALAVTADGTPQGLIGQKYWARRQPLKLSKVQLRKRPTKDTETQHWIDVIDASKANLSVSAPSTKPWFQIDRGGDAGPLLAHVATDERCWFTTRATHDRRVYSTDPTQRYLWDDIHRHEPLGSYVIEVAKPSTRRAEMDLFAAPVTLDVGDARGRRRTPVQVWAVLATERRSSTSGKDLLEWMLLTTYPVTTLEAAGHVVLGYAQRWRIEEFHKAWKSGACKVEESQLRDAEHLIPWAIILASVGVRILRLTYLARTAPDTPATIEFDTHEIRVVVALAKIKKKPVGTPTIKQVVGWISQLGGYIGPASGGPPGALVIARGLDRLQLAFELFEAVDET